MSPAHSPYWTQVKAMNSWLAGILNQFLLTDLELPHWSGLGKGAGFRQGWMVRTSSVCYNRITTLTATPSHPFPSPTAAFGLLRICNPCA